MEDVTKEDSGFAHSHSHPQTNVGQSTSTSSSTSAPPSTRAKQGGTARDNLPSRNTGIQTPNAQQQRGKATATGNLVRLILFICFNLYNDFKHCLLISFFIQFWTLNIVHSLYGQERLMGPSILLSSIFVCSYNLSSLQFILSMYNTILYKSVL